MTGPSRLVRQRLARHLGLGMIVLLAIALIVASPLALILIDRKGVDWDRLSSIGQSYGAISAILSATPPAKRAM